VRHVGLYLDPRVVGTLLVGALAATPLVPAVVAWAGRIHGRSHAWGYGLEAARLVALAVLFVLSSASLLASTNHPFIYFRF
jgi:hypothetical protein